MKTSVILSLDTRKSKKDGSYPIILRLSHFSSTTAIATGYSVKKDFWDETNKKIKNNYKGSESIGRFNNLLNKRLISARDIIIKLHEKNELHLLSVAQVREKISAFEKTSSLTHYADELITNMRKMNKFGNARAYASSIQAVSKHVNKQNVLFRDINYQFLKSFETAYLSRNNSRNGLSAILRSLRALINKAIAEGVIDKDSSPFINYKISSTPTAKRAVDHEAINKIVTLDLDNTHPCFDARNIFILSYYLWGMNFTDLAFLKVGDLIDGRLKYERRKTHRPYDIKIQPEMQIILEYYSKDKDRTDFILPIIKRTKEFEQDKDIQWCRKRYNKKLKAIAKLCGIQENITSYVSRHSFATLAEESGIPLRVISKMLGHTRLSTTEIYLRGFSNSSIDDYHQLLLKK